MNKKIYLSDLNATEKFGQSIAQAIEKHALIALSGQLGTGKTTLVKALAQALNVREIISSPTFTLMNEYHSGRLSLYHLDLYRFSTVTDSTKYDLSFLAAELDEFIAHPSVIIIEWPEYFYLSDQSKPEQYQSFWQNHDHLKIALQYEQDETARSVTIEGQGQAAIQLATTLSRSSY